MDLSNSEPPFATHFQGIASALATTYRDAHGEKLNRAVTMLVLVLSGVGCSGHGTPQTTHPQVVHVQADVFASDASIGSEQPLVDSSAQLASPAVNILPRTLPTELACIGLAPTLNGVLLTANGYDKIVVDSLQARTMIGQLLLAGPGRATESLHTTTWKTVSMDVDDPGNEPARNEAQLDWLNSVAHIEASLTATPLRPCMPITGDEETFSTQINGVDVRLFVERNDLKLVVGRARPRRLKRMTVSEHDGGDHERLAAAFTVAETSWLIYAIANEDTARLSYNVFAIDITQPQQR